MVQIYMVGGGCEVLSSRYVVARWICGALLMIIALNIELIF